MQLQLKLHLILIILYKGSTNGFLNENISELISLPILLCFLTHNMNSKQNKITRLQNPMQVAFIMIDAFNIAHGIPRK